MKIKIYLIYMPVLFIRTEKLVKYKAKHFKHNTIYRYICIQGES